ncbi:hypothetical protein TNCV_247881 [Trichonephila clavipes]|nr:hypothetical protein TNCV_247881 [Trichonephila clavipes]
MPSPVQSNCDAHDTIANGQTIYLSSAGVVLLTRPPPCRLLHIPVVLNDFHSRETTMHGTGGEGNIIQPPALVVSAATTKMSFGPSDLTSTYSVYTRRVFGGIEDRTQAFSSGVRCSDHKSTHVHCLLTSQCTTSRGIRAMHLEVLNYDHMTRTINELISLSTNCHLTQTGGRLRRDILNVYQSLYMTGLQ